MYWLFPLCLLNVPVYGLWSDGACVQSTCVNATYVAGSLTYELQVTDSVGWTGLGFGRQMVNTHMVIMWANEDGTTTLSQRYAKAHIQPEPSDEPPHVATLVQPAKKTRPAGSTVFAFKIPVNETYFSAAFSKHSIVWAYSRRKPSSNRPSATIYYHDARGVFNLNMKSDTEKIPGNEDESVPLSSFERLTILHGLFLSFGFLVLLPTGGLVARYARSFTSKWLKIHQACNMFAGIPVITLGSTLAFTAILLNEGSHLADFHHRCGIALLTMYFLQVGLGIFIHRKRPTGGPSHPGRNVIHVALGLIIITCAFFQINGGVYEWEAKTGRTIHRNWLTALRVWSLVLPLLYIGGLALLPRQFGQEKEARRSRYIALSDGSDLSQTVSNADEDGLVERDAT